MKPEALYLADVLGASVFTLVALVLCIFAPATLPASASFAIGSIGFVALAFLASAFHTAGAANGRDVNGLLAVLLVCLLAAVICGVIAVVLKVTA